MKTFFFQKEQTSLLFLVCAITNKCFNEKIFTVYINQNAKHKKKYNSKTTTLLLSKREHINYKENSSSHLMPQFKQVSQHAFHSSFHFIGIHKRNFSASLLQFAIFLARGNFHLNLSTLNFHSVSYCCSFQNPLKVTRILLEMHSPI